jgi:hypothetical protein
MNVDDLIKALQVVPNPSATEVSYGALIFAAGDFTGGAAEDLFTLAAHGLVDGDVVALVYESAAGVVTGAIGDTFIVNQLSSSTFQLTSDGSTVIENTADGNAGFMKVSLSIANATEAGIDEDDAGSVALGG